MIIRVADERKDGRMTMKWIEIKVCYEFDKDLPLSDLIADIFYELGVKGVITEDPNLEISDDSIFDADFRPADGYAVIGFIPKNDLARERCIRLDRLLTELKADKGVLTAVCYRDLDEEDWAESWKSFFWPEKVSDRIVIRPTWREYDAQPDDVVIDIDPGMAFGSGTHPTTRTCLKMIERYLKPGDSVLDVGTGSGILMIAAAKLGAANLHGEDIDELSVTIAEKNLRLNHISPELFSVSVGNLAQTVTRRYDLVLANIISEPILMLLNYIQNVIRKDGRFICSGIVEDNKAIVVDKMKAVGFEIADVWINERWVTICGIWDVSS